MLITLVQPVNIGHQSDGGAQFFRSANHRPIVRNLGALNLKRIAQGQDGLYAGHSSVPKLRNVD